MPLDYSVGVDERFRHFLSYGHINIYTPSLFRFLLKSEGYEVLDDRLTYLADEIIRFNWYRNQKLEKTWRRELSLHAASFFRWLRRLKLGRERYREFGYSAYTCLTRGCGEITVF